MQGKFSREVLANSAASTHYQCSIHCDSSRVALGASKWRWGLQATRDTPKGVQRQI